MTINPPPDPMPVPAPIWDEIWEIVKRLKPFYPATPPIWPFSAADAEAMFDRLAVLKDAVENGTDPGPAVYAGDGGTGTGG